MLFISSIILFFILSITKIKSNNPISFKIQIKHGNDFTIPLFTTKIGNSNIDTVYSGLNTENSKIFYAFTPNANCVNKTMNGQCYKGEEKKKLNKTEKISLFGFTKEGPLYKENIIIGESKFELEFVYVEVLKIYNGYINFGSKSLNYLKNKKIIPLANIHYSPYDEKTGSMNVTIGSNYSINNAKYYDTCDIIGNLSGCMLKKINIVNNVKKDDNKTIEINASAEFFNSELFQNNETVVVGNSEKLNQIINELVKYDYTCDKSGIVNCRAPNKTLYLIFGEKGIKLSKISFHPTAHHSVVFGFNTFKDIDIVIDYDKKKVFFYSGTFNTTSTTSNTKSGTTKLIIIISIIVGVLILGAILFYFLFHKKEKVDIEASGAETLLGEEN